MSPVILAFASIKNRFFSSLLTAVTIALGIALLVTVFLISNAIQDGLAKNSQGIDVVVGAKGSPTQLVLSSIYHSDIPNGNIEMKDFEQLKLNPKVRQAIPLAMGDNYKGWRIIGTTADYLDHFDAKFAQGRMFSQTFEAVAGASTKLKIGDEFAAQHGFATDSDDVHNFHLYKIVGVLEPTGSVLDRLITTPFQGVQELHAHPDEHDHDAGEELELGHQITAVLIKVKSPIAILNLPREIKKSSDLLAVSPSYQMAKLSQSLGMGQDVLVFIGCGIVLLSTLMLLSMLIGSLSSRQYDLAILRVMGASRKTLFLTLVAEGVSLAFAGSLAGIILGHIIAVLISAVIPSLQGIILPQALLVPNAFDASVLFLGTSAGFVAALIPAIRAKNTNIAIILAKGHL